MKSESLIGIALLLSCPGSLTNCRAEDPIATLVVLSNPYITTLPAAEIKDELGRDRGWLSTLIGPAMSKSVEVIQQIKPDAVVILGSLTWTGSDADFNAFAKSIEGIKAPVFLTPGLMDTPEEKFGGYLKRFEKLNAAQSLKKVKGVHLLFAHDLAQSRPLRKAMERMKRQFSEAGPAKATLLFGGRAHHRSWGELNPQNDDFWNLIEEHKVAARFQPIRYNSSIQLARTLPVFVVGSTGWTLRGAVTAVRVYANRVRVEIVSDPTQPTFGMDVPNPVSALRMKTAEADPYGSPSYSVDLAAKPDFTFAAVSDPQLSIGKTRDSLLSIAAKNIEELNKLSPKMVFVTGDLVEDNLPAEYALFRETFDKLKPPAHLMPGNHDVLYCHKFVEQMYTDSDKRKPEEAKVSRAAAKAVEKEGFTGPTCLFEKFLGIKPRQTILQDNSAFICMRILTQNVEAAELQWLREQLEKTKEVKHVFVLGHYPVLPAFGNNVLPTAGGNEVLKLLKDYKVAAFIFGHRHRNGFRMHEGTAHVLTDNMRSIHLFHVFKDRIVLGRKSVGSPLYEKITLPEPRAGGWELPAKPAAKQPKPKPAAAAPAARAPSVMKEPGIVFYLPFEGDLVARTPATEVEPTAGIILTEDLSQSVTIGELQKGKQTKVGGVAILDTDDGRFSYVPGVHHRAVHLKQMLTYPAPWMKGMEEGTIVVWYRNPIWRMLTWRVPAMLTTAQTYPAKPAAFQTPLSHWIFDRMTSPPEKGNSKWKHWSIVNNEHPRNLTPRIESDNQWHSWVMRWKRDGHRIEILDDNRLRDISKYESLVPAGKDNWEDYYLGRKSIVFEDVDHIKLDEILLGEIHLARYAHVQLDEICVWNRALSNEDLTKAFARGKAGETSFPASLLPKPKRRLTEGLDLASQSQERPALPTRWIGATRARSLKKTRRGNPFA